MANQKEVCFEKEPEVRTFVSLTQPRCRRFVRGVVRVGNQQSPVTRPTSPLESEVRGMISKAFRTQCSTPISSQCMKAFACPQYRYSWHFCR